MVRIRIRESSQLEIHGIRIQIHNTGIIMKGASPPSDSFLQRLYWCKNSYFFSYFLTHRQIIFSLKNKSFCKIFFGKHYFSPLNIFMRKGKDPEPDPYFWLMDPDPGRPKNLRIPKTALRQLTGCNVSGAGKWTPAWRRPFRKQCQNSTDCSTSSSAERRMIWQAGFQLWMML